MNIAFREFQNTNTIKANENKTSANKKARNIAIAAGVIAATGTAIYLGKTGKLKPVQNKIKAALAGSAAGLKVLEFFEKISQKAGTIKETVLQKAKDSHLTEKAEQVKTVVKEKAENLHLGEKAEQVKTAVKEKAENLHLGEKAEQVKTAVKEKAENLHLGEKAKQVKDFIKSKLTELKK